MVSLQNEHSYEPWDVLLLQKIFHRHHNWQTSWPCVFFSWIFNFLKLIKDFWHSPHKNGESPVVLSLWMMMCFLRDFLSAKNLPHMLNWYGISPERVLRWLLRWSEFEKYFSQCLQKCFLSVLWVLMWFFRYPDSLNDFSQIVQE